MRFMKMWSAIIPAAGLVAMLAATGSMGQAMQGMTGDTAKTAAHAKKLKPQATCPVTGDPINKKLYVDHKGKRIYVCCPMCIDSVKKDPEKYVKKLESMGQGVETISAKTLKESKSAKADTSTAAEAGYWTCPMHPEIHKSAPGQCPICGMNLEYKKVAKDAPKAKSTEMKDMKM